MPSTTWELQSDEQWLQDIVSWSVHYGPKVFEQFLLTTLRQIGGDRGIIFRSVDSRLEIETSWDRNELVFKPDPFSLQLSRQVRMTHRHVMKNMSSSSDARMRSVLVMPIQLPYEQESLILYLENRHLASVFHEKSVNIVALLITRLVYLMVLNHNQNDMIDKRSETASHPLIEMMTDRELEVLHKLAEGLSNKEIAVQLNITETTVKKHVSNIYAKLNVKRRGQAIAKARELDLI